MSMTSSEMGAAQHSAPPAFLPSPGHHPPPQEQDEHAHDFASEDAEPSSCRATRSSFPLSHQEEQNGETAMELAKVSDTLASSEKHFRGGAWKDEWVVSLIRLRGSMDEEFMKPQKPGIDMWSRVSSQIAEAHEDFDKNSESCRKKWQRVYKAFKDDKVLLATPCSERQLSCKWYNLVEHYMHDHVDRNGDALGGDEATALEETGRSDYAVVAHVDPSDFAPRNKIVAKRARRDEKVKESLSQMVDTWRESLEVLKDSEAKRLEILQTLSATMAGLLDVLRK